MNCNPCDTHPAPFYTTLKAHYPAYDFGGTLGVQDTIVIQYDYAKPFGVHYEVFWLAKGWGHVRWQYFAPDQQGITKQVYDILLNGRSGITPTPPQGACVAGFQTGGLLDTGWENGQELGLQNRVEYYRSVTGASSGRSGEMKRNGNYAFKISGYSQSDSQGHAYSYHRVFDRKIDVVQGMKIGYWINHQTGSPKIALDGHFTDGNTIRDFGGGALKDQYGIQIHPAARKDLMNQWYYVEVDLSPAAGKTLDYLMLAFDNGGDGFTGAYLAYVDDLKVFIP